MKTGYISVLGEPNVGKSTLINRLLRDRISIVTEKPQTTRHKILGILTEENYQLIFIDTPGIIENPRNQLQKVMQKNVENSIRSADLIYLLIDAKKPVVKERYFKHTSSPIFLLINKIDLIDRRLILPIIEEYKNSYFKEIIPISALKGDGMDDIIQTTLNYIPENDELYYPSEYISDKPERFFIGEIIREKIYEFYGEEIPYATGVFIEDMKERGNKKKDYIKAVIFVEKDSQKGIIIGKNGEKLKKLGTISRRDIEVFLERPVYLELKVKTFKNWRKNAEAVKKMGYK